MLACAISGCSAEHASRLLPATPTVVLVGEAREAQELGGRIGGRARRASGTRDVARDDVEVSLEPGPTGEAVPACDDQLSRASGDPGVLGRSGAPRWVMVGDEREGIGRTRAHRALQVAGLLPDCSKLG